MRTRLGALGALLGTILVAGACVPPPPGPPATYTEGPCPTDSGVTVVVDFADLGPDEIVRCALGPQADGYAALAAIGVDVTTESGPGTVCTMDGLPAEGYPFCWLTGGYWSSWRVDAQGDPWAFATTGAGDGPLVEGSVEGWAWAPGFVSDGPSVGSDGS